MASARVPVESCGNVQLQWYIHYDGLRERGLEVDPEKYNSGSGPTMANLTKEIKKKSKQHLLQGLCKGDYDLLYALRELTDFNVALICRNVENEEIYGFGLMNVVYRQQGETEIDHPVPNIMHLVYFCGHRNLCGVGKKMMSSMKKFCVDNHLLEIVLVPLDDDSIGFYRNQGFVGWGDGYMVFRVEKPVAKKRSRSPDDKAEYSGVQAKKTHKRKSSKSSKSSSADRSRGGQATRKRSRRRPHPQ
jgi:hypothetical protein